jgi:hypothetical protein
VRRRPALLLEVAVEDARQVEDRERGGRLTPLPFIAAVDPSRARSRGRYWSSGAWWPDLSAMGHGPLATAVGLRCEFGGVSGALRGSSRTTSPRSATTWRSRSGDAREPCVHCEEGYSLHRAFVLWGTDGSLGPSGVGESA